MNSPTELAPVIIFGATGVGKTQFLETLSRFWQERKLSSKIEVIVADSRQVYKHMPIVTAQASRALCEKIPHHLVETLDCHETYTVADFYSQASELVLEIKKRGNIPIIIGGTPYYLYHFWKGLPKTPKVPQELRDAVRRDYEAQGLDVLYQELQRRDSKYAKHIAAQDTQRILRAVEILRYSDTPLHVFKKEQSREHHSVFIGLGRERAVLYKRINERIDAMYKKGLFAEVKALWEQGLSSRHNAFFTIGIREILETAEIPEHWKRHESVGAKLKEAVLCAIKQNSRRYAKRQLTFFRKFNTIQWYNLDEPGSEQRICELIYNYYAQ